eukprot:4361149-Pyramimonas_sp.AAC.1
MPAHQPRGPRANPAWTSSCRSTSVRWQHSPPATTAWQQPWAPTGWTSSWRSTCLHRQRCRCLRLSHPPWDQ